MVQDGLIFDIQRYSINDGPGIRTTVFFKGCPLTCLWCDNPESQKLYPQLLFFESLCIRCHRCVQTCPTGATKVSSEGSIKIARDQCQACGACVKACLSGARVISGNRMTVEEVLDVVKKDSLFYRNSGGGVTASGGEPTYQPDFLFEFFRKCQECGIHTTLDTCGHVSWGVLEIILEYVDLVLFDIKHMEPARHKELTGVSNELILDNARRIAQKGKLMIIRAPLIPTYNDSAEDIKVLGAFISELGLSRIDLVLYHQLGESKYPRLGREYELRGIRPHEDTELQVIQEMLESYKLEVSIA